jgi:hypothetical protein
MLTDLLIGLVIFSIALVVYFRVFSNITDNPEILLEELGYDANVIAGSLGAKGYPENWDASSVQRIGLLTDGQLDRAKLQQFEAMTFAATKTVFGTRFDYTVFFRDADGNVLNIESCAFGSPDIVVNPLTQFICENVSVSSLDTQHLVQSERIIAHEARLITMVVYVWQ